MKILEVRTDKLVTLVGKGISLLTKKCSMSRDYGYFTVFDDGVILICKLNAVPQEKLQKYLACSQEKAWRLHSKPADQTSFQSRNPERDKWGGAIRACGSHILSFSGLPNELFDEALMAYVACTAGWIDKSDALKIAAISSNSYVAEIL